MNTPTIPRAVKADPTVVHRVLALAEQDWDAAVHEAYRIGLLTRAHLEWAFEFGADALDIVRGSVPPVPDAGPWGQHNPCARPGRSMTDLVAALGARYGTTYAIHAPAPQDGLR